MASWLVRSSSEGAVLTLTVPLFAQGNKKTCGGMAYDGPVSCPGGVGILLAVINSSYKLVDSKASLTNNIHNT